MTTDTLAKLADFDTWFQAEMNKWNGDGDMSRATLLARSGMRKGWDAALASQATAGAATTGGGLTTGALTDHEIETLAHRMCWRYKHDGCAIGGPVYTFNRVTLLDFARKLTQSTPAPSEPFGYFKAAPFGWTDCAETDDGAVALYERPQQSAQAPVGWVSVATKAPPHVTLDLALSDGTVTVGEFMSALGWHWDEVDDSDPDAEVTHWRPRPTHPAQPASRPQPPQPQSAQTQGDA